MNIFTGPGKAHKIPPFTGLESEQKPHPNANIDLSDHRPLAPELLIDDRYEGFSFPIDNDVSRFASRNSELRRKIGLIKYERDELSRLYEELIAKNLQLRNENKSFLEEGDCDLRTSADYIRFDFTGTDDNQDPIYQRVFLLNEIALMLKEIKVLQNDNRRIEDLNTGWDLIMKLED
jgi:hypothetical protein